MVAKIGLLRRQRSQDIDDMEKIWSTRLESLCMIEHVFCSQMMHYDLSREWLGWERFCDLHKVVSIGQGTPGGDV